MSVSAKDAFRERERALEDEFFHRVDQQLMQRLRDTLTHAQQREPLSAATGLSDEALLDELIDVGVSAESLAAMTLAPMVCVAWANGKMEESERQTILHAAADAGLEADSPAGDLLKHWLEQPPNAELLTVWKHYVKSLTDHTSATAKRVLRRDIMLRTEEVAKAAKSMWGKSLTPSEKRVLKEVNEAFGE